MKDEVSKVSAAWLISWTNQPHQTSPTKDSFSPSPASPSPVSPSPVSPSPVSFPLQGSPPDDLPSFFDNFEFNQAISFAIHGIRNDLSVSFEVRTNCVMLFSDGHVNTGETNSKTTFRFFWEGLNTKVSSFGIGLGFNEDLMKEIALDLLLL